MKNRILFPIIVMAVSAGLGGCASMSKMATGFSEKKRASQFARNPEQMRVATDGAILQPMTKVEMPQFQGLQAPLAGAGRKSLETTPRPINLPRFTPVKILSSNRNFTLVETSDGTRGYLPPGSVEKESIILASAKPAIPNQPVYAAQPNQESLYLPHMDATDSPVDQAMLNEIDSIKLPESESPPHLSPEGHEVDGIIIRKSSKPSAGAPGLANSIGAN